MQADAYEAFLLKKLNVNLPSSKLKSEGEKATSSSY
jgi:hypothetical protein